MHLIAVPAFADNYLWVLHGDKTPAGKRALVVDPGAAEPIVQTLAQHGLTLEAILVTHHHADHTGGVATLRQQTGAQVYGPARERTPQPAIAVQGGDRLDALGLAFTVIDVPGHTAGHIAYYTPQVVLNGAAAKPLLFCGDTLFSGGCGRLFEGTPAQMLASLDALAALPPETVVCCAHEYTLANLRFARMLEPDNAVLQAFEEDCQVLRAQQLPTLPTTLGQQLQINPFLRTREPSIAEAARRYNPSALDPVAVFAALRLWKNNYS